MFKRSNTLFIRAASYLISLFLAIGWARGADVELVRVPNGGVQPQALVDAKGTIHLIYLAGDPAHSDIFYIRSTDEGKTFSDPIRVNSQSGSAVAMGTVRGAHLAMGKGESLHVAWMGSSIAEPKAPKNLAPMLYTQMAAGGKAFEPQRNLIVAHPGLDGGGSIAADGSDNVYVCWHAPLEIGAGEQSRHLWLSKSVDEGKTFSREESISPDTGACGCCGIRLFVANGTLYALYRTADKAVHRDMTLLRVNAQNVPADAQTVGTMQLATCVMSTAALSSGPQGKVLAAWERNGQIEWSAINQPGDVHPTEVAGAQRGRKHPALCANKDGRTLIAWTEGTGWNRGGSIAWQQFDTKGTNIESGSGRAEGLPAWGAPAAVALRDGKYVIFY